MNAGRATRQLEPILGKTLADPIVSLALGIDHLLLQNPVVSVFTALVAFPALAVLYGTARQVCTEVMEDASQLDEVREDARQTLELMNTAVRLTDAPDPQPQTAHQQIIEDACRRAAAMQDDDGA